MPSRESLSRGLLCDFENIACDSFAALVVVCPHLQLGVEHLAEAGGEAAEVAVPLLHLCLQTPLELAAEDLLLAGEVDDALLHPRELRR